VILDVAGNDFADRDLRYWTMGEDGWSASVVVWGPEVADFPRLAFDLDGQPLVTYQHGPNWNEVMIARPLADGSWQHDAIVTAQDRESSYAFLSFAVDNSGLPAVVYRASPSGTPSQYLVFAQARKQ
jgi:hypothetical protein